MPLGSSFYLFCLSDLCSIVLSWLYWVLYFIPCNYGLEKRYIGNVYSEQKTCLFISPWLERLNWYKISFKVGIPILEYSMWFVVMCLGIWTIKIQHLRPVAIILSYGCHFRLMLHIASSNCVEPKITTDGEKIQIRLNPDRSHVNV